ncbi:phage tail tape measure protein, TP901 family, core region [Loktanella atrilutea]|uniref:Phage tail tape measure protein, TP901 family, core region n=1 Tax=Loktanella atrilutea TaxID=366533 RepID=A0A1M4WE74_LOKAT|nr:phage tail tape measure protein [Loktanella atrilutea]SHE79524.1 phage tail tape measure protein, TP901 family, core region [Loktanella atrilutea]
MARLSSELILSLVDRVSGPSRNVREAMDRTGKAIERNQRSIRQTQGAMVGSLAAAAAVAASIRGPVVAAMEFQSAMADVRKVVDFPTPEAFEEFQQFILDLSKEIPVATQELAELAAKGGESGLRGEELKQYVEMAAKLKTAFGVSADAAGTFMNSMRNALGLGMDDTLLLADAVNHLTNNMAANAPDLSAFMVSIAGDIAKFGLDPDEAAAFGAAMLAAGQAVDVSATSFRNMGRALTKGTSATKRQRSAMDDLGLSSVDVAKRMQEDATETIIDVMERIAALPKEMQAAVTSDIFGDEARALSALMSNTDLLRESLGYVADSAAYAGSAYKEYESRSKTFEADLQRFRNVGRELAITLGDALIPVLTETMQSVTPYITAIAGWIKQNRELVGTIFRVSSALIGLRIGFLGLKLAGLYGRGGALWLLAQGMGMIGRTSGGLIGAARSQMALSAALAAMDGSKVTTVSKVGAALRGLAGVTRLSLVASGLASVAGVVAGISAPLWGGIALAALAIGTAGTAIYKNWDRVAAIMRGVASALWDAHPAVNAVKAALDRFPEIGRAAGDALNWIKTAASDLWSYITGFFGPDFFSRNILSDGEKASIEQRARDMTAGIIAAIQSLPTRLLAIGSDAVQKLWDGMKAKFADLMKWVRGIPGEIASAVGTISLGDGEPSAGSNGRRDRRRGNRPAISGARVYGGAVAAGKTYLTGERGPELITPSRAAYVATAGQLRSLSAQRVTGGRSTQGPANITFGDIILTNPPGATAEELSREFGRQTGALMRSHYSDAN